MCIVKARSALLFGASTPAGANRGSLMSSGFVRRLPLRRVGRVGHDRLERLVVPVRRIDEGVAVGDVELLEVDVVQEHVDAGTGCRSSG
jgi:hypothetical protein